MNDERGCKKFQREMDNFCKISTIFPLHLCLCSQDAWNLMENLNMLKKVKHFDSAPPPHLPCHAVGVGAQN